jgi:hypothetical protein
MVQTISAEKVTLYELEQHFGLVQVEDGGLFLRMADRLTSADGG